MMCLDSFELQGTAQHYDEPFFVWLNSRVIFLCSQWGPCHLGMQYPWIYYPHLSCNVFYWRTSTVSNKDDYWTHVFADNMVRVHIYELVECAALRPWYPVKKSATVNDEANIVWQSSRLLCSAISDVLCEDGFVCQSWKSRYIGKGCWYVTQIIWKHFLKIAWRPFSNIQ